MKVLVLGAYGMIGHTVTIYFHEQGHEVTTLTLKPCTLGSHNVVGNATDINLIKELMKQDFDAVINCIGVLNEFAEKNKSEAIYLNAYLPHKIASLLDDKKAKLIQMSTDCVFSGERGRYREDDVPDGEKFYDKTKAMGEIQDNKNLTFRNSVVGPDINEAGIGLFNWFMKQNGTIMGFVNTYWNGVTTLTLAKAMEKALINDFTGLYHLVPQNKISKYGLCSLFNKHFKGNKIEIIPTEKKAVDKSLISTRKDFKFIVPSFEAMIEEMKDWILAHKELYKHYDIER